MEGNKNCRDGQEVRSGCILPHRKPRAGVIGRCRKKRRAHAATKRAAIRHGVVTDRTGAVEVDCRLVGAGYAKRVAERIQHAARGHRANRPCRGKRLQHKHKRRGKRDKCPRCALPPEQDLHPSRWRISIDTSAREVGNLTCDRMLDDRIIDPLARFHIGNGASLARINAFGDSSPRAMGTALGLMVNCRYRWGRRGAQSRESPLGWRRDGGCGSQEPSDSPAGRVCRRAAKTARCAGLTGVDHEQSSV